MVSDNKNRLELSRQLLEKVHGLWTTQAIYVAAELGIADHLQDGPQTSSELAKRVGVEELLLRRLLGALTALGLCRHASGCCFELTDLGELLRADAPYSLKACVRWWGSNLWNAWGHLLYCVKTGESARTLLHGTEGFDHLRNDPEAAALFHQACAQNAELVAFALTERYDFSRFQQIADIGGGHGALLAQVLTEATGASGILFDQPHSIKGAQDYFAARDLIARCNFVAGDFFEEVPSGADMYILKNILHNWDKDKSRSILRNCRRAMHPESRLLIIERMLPDRIDTSTAHQETMRSDLNMLVALGAGERTQTEYQSLVRSSGMHIACKSSLVLGFDLLDVRVAGGDCQ